MKPGKTAVLILIVVLWIVTLPTSVPALGDLYLWWNYGDYRETRGIIRGTDKRIGKGTRRYYTVKLRDSVEVTVWPETRPLKKVGDEISILLWADGHGTYVAGRNMGAIESFDGIAEASIKYFALWFSLLFLPSIAGIFVMKRLRPNGR